MAKLFENPRMIAIEGPIRAGKSTLARMLAEKTGAQCIAEPQKNPFLNRFYGGETTAAFPVQMWFLTSRYEQLFAAERDTRSSQSVSWVADYIFEKDKIFACLNLSDDELTLYNRQYHYFREQLPTPELVIYLQASPQVLRTRIKRKGLLDERTISNGYLEQVVQAYEHFFFHYSASDLLVVNTDDIDFVYNNHDLQMLLRRLSEPVRGTQYFLPLGRGDADISRGLHAGGRMQSATVPTAVRGFGPGVVQTSRLIRWNMENKEKDHRCPQQPTIGIRDVVRHGNAADGI